MTRKPFHLDVTERKSFSEAFEDTFFGRDFDPTLPINPQPRHKVALDSFVAYCNAHPEQRFWQAIRNWSKYHTIFGFNGDVYVLEDSLPEDVLIDLQDTFYIEGLDGTR